MSAEFRLRVGNLDIMPKGCHQKSQAELLDLIQQKGRAEQTRILKAIDLSEIEDLLVRTFNWLETSLGDPNDSWKTHFPGRQILKQFCSAKYADFDFGRFKTAYIAAAENAPSKPFAEIEEIFRTFSEQ